MGKQTVVASCDHLSVDTFQKACRNLAPASHDPSFVFHCTFLESRILFCDPSPSLPRRRTPLFESASVQKSLPEHLAGRR